MENIIVEKSKLNDKVLIYRRKIEDTNTGKEKKRKRVAAYCRVSTKQELQESSIQMQIAAYKRAISERIDWELVDIYVDHGITGTCTKKRPGFLRMIEDCKQGKIDMIIAKSASRFSRNTVDMLEYIRMLKELGVSVFFEKERIDTGELSSEFLLTVYAAFAQEESASISGNVRRGVIQKYQMGIPMFSKLYGLTVDKNDKHKWVIVEEEAKVVRKIYDLYLHGSTTKSIVNWLNDNIELPNGKKWLENRIKSILRNEKYVGDVIMQKTVVIDVLNHKVVHNDNIIAPMYYLKDHHEAIINREKHITVARMFELKKQTSGTHQYPYYDYLRCPYCGGQMVQFRTWLKTNELAWVCSNIKKCKTDYVLTKYIDKAVLSAIIELDLTDATKELKEIKELMINKGNIELYYLRKLIKKIEFIDGYSWIKITYYRGEEYIYKINNDSIKELPKCTITRKGSSVYINDIEYTKDESKEIIDSINDNKKNLKSLVFMYPNKDNGIIRIRK